jgi:hypothetical protein
MVNRYKRNFLLVLMVMLVFITITPLVYVTNMSNNIHQHVMQLSIRDFDDHDISITLSHSKTTIEKDIDSSLNFSQKHNDTKTTKILGFSNAAYKEMTVRWYHEMSSLGYTNIYAIASDAEAAHYFIQNQIQFDYLNPTRKGWVWGKDTCSNYTRDVKEGKIAQTYRRSLFGARWNYILRQLHQGYHVFITDVDNLFQVYKPMSDFEHDEYDMVHAFSGDINAFPRNIYRQRGFNICGGLSWLRSTPSVIEFVSELARRCGCKESIGCECHCDDQVAINTMYLEGEYNATWNQKPHQKIIATRTDEIYWDGFDGICQKTGHKMMILDRNIAWRGSVHKGMICPQGNWIAMPQGQKDKNATRELWEEYCKNDTNSAIASNISP